MFLHRGLGHNVSVSCWTQIESLATDKVCKNCVAMFFFPLFLPDIFSETKTRFVKLKNRVSFCRFLLDGSKMSKSWFEKSGVFQESVEKTKRDHLLLEWIFSGKIRAANPSHQTFQG